jgi:hypothetical protein
MRTGFSGRTSAVMLCALAVICAGAMASGGLTSPQLAGAQRKPVAALPFSLTVDPGHSGITMARKNPNEFYVVLTNISDKPQPAWRSGSSWAYKNISFEFTLPDGREFTISEAPQGFTVNFPSTFVIDPGEHRVFPIRLNEWWEAHPSLPKSAETPIKLKAIYEVPSTPEGTQFKVWVGHVESKTYNFTLRQW